MEENTQSINKLNISKVYGYKLKDESTIISSQFINRIKFPPQIKHSYYDKKILLSQIKHIFIKKMFIFWYLLCTLIALMITINILQFKLPMLHFPKKNIIFKKIYTPQQLTLIGQALSEITTNSNDSSNNNFSKVGHTTYILQSGDALLTIAKKFNRHIDTIVSWNNILDARKIWAGDKIIIPNKDGLLHTVKKGENIANIAKKYNVSSVSILDANDLSSDVVLSGTKLFIPEATMDEFELGLVLGTVFIYPTIGAITSGYGYRISPITGAWTFHGAIDIHNRLGVPVSTVTHGVVSYVAYNTPVYGNMIVIKHPGGFQSLYAHLDKIYVSKGQSLTRGRTIGTMGNTGQSTGPHLHFALILNGTTVNPLRFISR